MTTYLDLDDLLLIARDAVDGEVAVRDHGLIASAAARSQTTVSGEDAYPTLHQKAAALLHSLVRNRALVDGNKRLAWLATFVFLDINGQALIAADDEVAELVLSIAEGTLDEVSKIAEQLSRWSRTA